MVEKKARVAEVVLVVRVKMSGGLKNIDQARHLARQVVESGSFAAAGLEGPGTHEYGEEESEDMITLESIESTTINFATMS